MTCLQCYWRQCCLWPGHDSAKASESSLGATHKMHICSCCCRPCLEPDQHADACGILADACECCNCNQLEFCWQHHGLLVLALTVLNLQAGRQEQASLHATQLREANLKYEFKRALTLDLHSKVQSVLPGVDDISVSSAYQQLCRRVT